jgi:hypothetical protein
MLPKNRLLRHGNAARRSRKSKAKVKRQSLWFRDPTDAGGLLWREGEKRGSEKRASGGGWV